MLVGGVATLLLSSAVYAAAWVMLPLTNPPVQCIQPRNGCLALDWLPVQLQVAYVPFICILGQAPSYRREQTQHIYISYERVTRIIRSLSLSVWSASNALACARLLMLERALSAACSLLRRACSHDPRCTLTLLTRLCRRLKSHARAQCGVDKVEYQSGFLSQVKQLDQIWPNKQTT
jgi:hypothetical protein